MFILVYRSNWDKPRRLRNRERISCKLQRAVEMVGHKNINNNILNVQIRNMFTTKVFPISIFFSKFCSWMAIKCPSKENFWIRFQTK